MLVSSVALFALGACRGQSVHTTQARVGYLRTQGPIVDLGIDSAAIEQGNIKLFPFESGNDVLEAIMADGIDVGETGEVQPIFAQSAGHKVKVVGSTEPAALTSMLVRDDAPLRNIADLKGRKVSFIAGTNSHWLLLRALDRAGLKQGDIAPVSLGGSDGLSALFSGDIDALVMTAPTTQIAVSNGARVLFNNRGLTNSALYYVAKDSTIAKRPELIEGFLRALSQHIRWTAQNPDRFIDVAVKDLGVTPDVGRALLNVLPKKLVPVGDGAVGTYNQQIADAFAAQGLIPGRIEAAQSVSGEFDKVLTP
ncbi:aliphatic sulfonate ABC transporter substrate-binding protein [Sphingomonas turrisvirgatae]|nr:aliphatic sulfonate ABC transporter substrate-binding protein [Sphingomonas turrisvirgatae]